MKEKECKHTPKEVSTELIPRFPYFSYIFVRCECGGRLRRVSKIVHVRCEKCGEHGIDHKEDWLNHEYGQCVLCGWSGPVIAGAVGP